MIKIAVISPHAPILLPKVGSNQDRHKLQKTLKSLEKLGEKMQKEKREKPTEQEQVVISFSRLISEAYVRACALNAFKTNYYSDINIAGKEMAEGYNSRIGSKK